MTIADIAVGSPADTARPWPGLDAFSEALQGFFFGRDAETDELFRRVRRDAATLLFGQSGLGKTSLLQAGLFPRLRAAGFLPTLVRLVYTAGAPAPTAQVKDALEREAASAGAEAAPIGADESLWAYFHRAEPVVASRHGEPLVPVLVFDQFEEMFTLGLARETERAAHQSFLGELAELIENRPPESVEKAIEQDPAVVEKYRFDRQDYRVVLALREDFLASLESLRVRAPLIGRNRFRLVRMTGRQGFEAVIRPMPGLVEPDLAREIVRFVGRANPEDAYGAGAGEPGDGIEVEPALLSLVCRELNERRLALGLDRITPDLLAGNRDSIIQSFYDTALADQPAAVREFIEDRLLSESGFRESVTLDGVRRALAAANVPAAALDTLVRRRLLRIEERLDVARVEIIHDVLTPVIRASRDTRHLQRAEAAAAEREHELRRARRRVGLAYAAAAIMAVLLVVAIGLGVLALRANQEAKRQKAVAEEQTAMAEREKAAAEQETAIAEREKAAAERSLDLATAIANGLVFDVVQKYRNAGVPAAVIADILARVRQLQEQLAAGGQTSPALRRSQAVALDETVDTLLTIGDTNGALAAATQSRDIMQTLVTAAPDSTDYQRALSVSDNWVGNVLLAQGDLAGALAQYRAMLAIDQHLAEKNAENTQSQRDLHVDHNKIGDVLKAQGDLAGALAAYRDGLAIGQALAQKDPGNTEWQRGLSVSDERIGDVLMAQGDLAGALAQYRAELAIMEPLAKKDPSNTDWQRFISIVYGRIGDVLRDQGDLNGALAQYRAELAIMGPLAKKDSSNTFWQRIISVADVNVGDVLKAQSDLTGALTAYRDSLAIRKALAQKDPSNVQWQTDVALSLWRMAAAGDNPSMNYAQALAILNRLDADGKLTAAQKGWIAQIEAAAAKAAQ